MFTSAFCSKFNELPECCQMSISCVVCVLKYSSVKKRTVLRVVYVTSLYRMSPGKGVKFENGNMPCLTYFGFFVTRLSAKHTCSPPHFYELVRLCLYHYYDEFIHWRKELTSKRLIAADCMLAFLPSSARLNKHYKINTMLCFIVFSEYFVVLIIRK